MYQLKDAIVTRLECGPAWTLAVVDDASDGESISSGGAGAAGCRCLLWGTPRGASAFADALLAAGLSSTVTSDSQSGDPGLDGVAVPHIQVPPKLLRLLDAPLELRLQGSRDLSLSTGVVARGDGARGDGAPRAGRALEQRLPANPCSYLDEVERACHRDRPDGFGLGGEALTVPWGGAQADRPSLSSNRTEPFDEMFASHVPPSTPRTPRSR